MQEPYCRESRCIHRLSRVLLLVNRMTVAGNVRVTCCATRALVLSSNAVRLFSKTKVAGGIALTLCSNRNRRHCVRVLIPSTLRLKDAASTCFRRCSYPCPLLVSLASEQQPRFVCICTRCITRGRNRCVKKPFWACWSSGVVMPDCWGHLSFTRFGGNGHKRQSALATVIS